MKKIVLILAVLSAVFPVFAEEELAIGTDIHAYMTDRINKLELGGPEQITDAPVWNGLSVTWHGLKNKKGKAILMARMDGQTAFPFGFMETEGDGLTYYYDMNGDKLIDTKTDILIIPFYFFLIYRNIETGDDPGFYDLMESIYQVFQSNAGPLGGSGMAKSYEVFAKAAGDTALVNRDLYYMLWFYSQYNQKFFYHSISLMEILASEVEKRYGKTHPLPYLYMLESIINSRLDIRIRETIPDILAKYPDCIPVQAYDYVHGVHTTRERKNLLKTLKTKYPEHWIIKTLQ